MLTVYGDSVSGNCYKIQLLASLLAIPINWVEMNILNGDSHDPAFLSLNPLGKVPLLKTPDGLLLSESNAILHYLADEHPIAGPDRLTQSKILQWQFFEQYSHEPYIAVARFINFYLGMPEERLAEYQQKQEGGHKALAHMEQQLLKTPFLVGNDVSLADISLYAYTHVAHQGGFELSQYGAIQRWIKRIEELPNYRPMSNPQS